MQKYIDIFFKVIEECRSWVSRNGAEQIFFLKPSRNMFAEKLVKWERFLAEFWEHFIFDVKVVEVHKMSEVFWGKLCCKMGDLFRYFLLGLRLSSRKSEIKEIWWCPLERVVEYKNIVRPKKYILNHWFLGNIFASWGTTLGRFSLCFLFVF